MTPEAQDRIAKAKSDFETQLTTMHEGIGDLGNYAHVYGQFVRTYMGAIQGVGRSFTDLDTFALLELSEIAQQALSLNQVRASGLNASIYALQRASFGKYPESAPTTPSRERRSMDVLWEEMAQAHGMPSTPMMNEWQGKEWPRHWTMDEGIAFKDYLRNLRQNNLAHNQVEQTPFVEHADQLVPDATKTHNT